MTTKKYNLYDFNVTFYQVFPIIFVYYLTAHLLFQCYIIIVCSDLENIHKDLIFLGEFIKRLKT